MQLKLTDLNPSIQQLIDDKYEIELRQQYLLVHSVPYVKPNRTLDAGVLVCLCPNATGSGAPSEHTLWFVGDMPCRADGRPLVEVVINSNKTTLENGIRVDHQFSNKQTNNPSFPSSYHEKIVHYVNLLQNQARAINNDVDARTGKPYLARNPNSVFKYGDSASARAGIYAISQKLENQRIAIIGLGGTGAYIMDQVAKTHVKEIHLFDDDMFGQFNAFRSPGAPTFEILEQEPMKVAYFKAMYEPMRNGIVEHPYRITQDNLQELVGINFVFVSVDKGSARRQICTFLKDSGIPFIDVGMGLKKIEDTLSLAGTCRATLIAPSKNGHLNRIPMGDEDANDLYHSNIQVADMNALNAMLAVVKWKQHFGFYEDSEKACNLEFIVGFNSLSRSEKY